MHVQQEQLELYLNPLVGTEEATEAFRIDLASRLGDHVGNPDAYIHLRTAVEEVVKETIDPHRVTAHTKPETGQWLAIAVNGKTGIYGSVAAAQAVGTSYEYYAQVPQQKSIVDRNLNRVIRHIYSAAFTGKFAGALNMEAIRLGLNPRNPLHLPVVAGALAVNWTQVGEAHRSIATTIDNDGQLDIRPKYTHLRLSVSGRCPATFTRTESGPIKSSLLAFMRAIGDVAATEIYPHRFDIE